MSYYTTFEAVDAQLARLERIKPKCRSCGQVIDQRRFVELDGDFYCCDCTTIWTMDDWIEEFGEIQE